MIPRGFPCTICPDEELWCIVGMILDSENRPCGGGVLDWCYDQKDAQDLLKEYKNNTKFSNCNAVKFTDFQK